MVKDTRLITGNQEFTVPASNFMISPLQANADLYLVSIGDNQQANDKLQTLSAGEYTNVRNSIPGVSYKVETTENFYIKW